MKLKIPWGYWLLETGEWFPNKILKMSVEEQRRQNIKNGFCCIRYERTPKHKP